MKSEYIDIKGKWGIVVCYDFDERDENDMANYMMALGAMSGDVDGALDVLFGQVNAGMCVTNSPLRMSLIFIGDADSAEQWWDTLLARIIPRAAGHLRLLRRRCRQRRRSMDDGLSHASGRQFAGTALPMNCGA